MRSLLAVTAMALLATSCGSPGADNASSTAPAPSQAPSTTEKDYLAGVSKTTFCKYFYVESDGAEASSAFPCTLKGINSVDDAISVTWVESANPKGFTEIFIFKPDNKLLAGNSDDNYATQKDGSYKRIDGQIMVSYEYEGQMDRILIPVNPLFSWER